jgi:hypothetical protein
MAAFFLILKANAVVCGREAVTCRGREAVACRRRQTKKKHRIPIGKNWFLWREPRENLEKKRKM